MPDGVILSLNLQKGFGFLHAEKGGEDLFFHRTACPELFTRLRDGQRVRLEVDASAERPRVQKLWVDGGDAGQFDRRPATTAGGLPRSAGRDSNARSNRGQYGGARDDRGRNDRTRDDRGARGPTRTGQQGAAARGGGVRSAGVRPAGGPRQSDGRSDERRSRSGPRVESKRPAVCEHGFITKLVTISATVPAHGFISPDGGGREIRFEPSVVEGFPRFMMLKVGDYVELAVIEETREYTSPEIHPAAYYVRAIERFSDEPRTQLPRHPKSRRRKPSWR